MTPRKKGKGHRAHGRGTLVIDRHIKGVGRLKRATGTHDPKQFKLYCGMVDALVAGGQNEKLRQLRDKSVSFADMWEHTRTHVGEPSKLNALPSALTARRLWRVEDATETGALAQFIASHDAGDHWRANSRQAAARLAKLATGTEAVSDLPALLKRLRVRCITAETPTAFNRTRTFVQAFLRATVGRFHPLYIAACEITPRPERNRPGNPLETAAELRAWCDKLARTMGPQYAEAFWAMAVTGMRPGEYWGTWEVMADRVRISTAKRKAGAPEAWREVPLVGAVPVPRLTQSTWHDEMGRRKQTGEHTPYDGRRTFARACETAGIPASRTAAYMGHGPETMTDLYLRHDVRPYLASDAEKLRAHFGVAGDGGAMLRVERGGGT